MASTNKTEKLKLNQWVATDAPEMADFNADNRRIEAALDTLPKIAAGFYAGNGVSSRTIPLDFTPRAVLVWRNDGTTKGYSNETFGGLAVTGSPVKPHTVNAVEIVTGGFNVAHNPDAICQTNLSGSTYNYLAVG